MFISNITTQVCRCPGFHLGVHRIDCIAYRGPVKEIRNLRSAHKEFAVLHKHDFPLILNDRQRSRMLAYRELAREARWRREHGEYS